jgi:hypothetical protein
MADPVARSTIPKLRLRLPPICQAGGCARKLAQTPGNLGPAYSIPARNRYAILGIPAEIRDVLAQYQALVGA